MYTVTQLSKKSDDGITRSRLRKWADVTAALILASLSGAAFAGQPSISTQAHPKTMAHDLSVRSHDIHWPSGFDPEKADLFAHNELLIRASCEMVWGHIVDAERWPQWYPNSKDISLLGGAKALGPDVRWRWTTFGLSIESQVHEYELNSRLGWYGYPIGAKPAFYHTWLLQPRGDSCLVIMEEAGVGEGVAQFRAADEGRMHRGHDLWLATLKWISEGP
ncbi:MAG TPA: SRPBCC family protein [Dyella sp.]|jgi:uncharacterized protein YndB with AHSA1/START domain